VHSPELVTGPFEDASIALTGIIEMCVPESNRPRLIRLRVQI
jgi:hypothetical protein